MKKKVTQTKESQTIVELKNIIDSQEDYIKVLQEKVQQEKSDKLQLYRYYKAQEEINKGLLEELNSYK